MKGLNRFCFLLGLIVILGILPAYAQVDYSTGTLRGTVTDPQGAVVPGAIVTVTNPSTGITKTAKPAPTAPIEYKHFRRALMSSP